MKIRVDLSMTVDADGSLSKKEMIQAAQRKMVEELNRKGFPQGATYTRVPDEAVPMESLHVGAIVEEQKEGIGIVTKVNKKTINVNFNGKTLQGSPSLFQLPSKKVDPCSLIKGKRIGKLGWMEGDTAFLNFAEKKLPVILTRFTSGYNFIASVVGENEEKTFKLTIGMAERYLSEA